MKPEQPEPGRARQRRRTRKAIVDAAMELIAQGETPSVAEIAEAADVSRRTVYLHFPNLEHLLTDAALGLFSRTAVDPVFDVPEGSIEERVDALVRALYENVEETEMLGRKIIRLTVEPPPSEEPYAGPRRGYRRVGWIEQALEPARAELGDERFERLVSALCLLVGWEATLLVLRDIRALDPAQGEVVATWAARALVRAALDEARSEKGVTPGT